MKSFMGVSLAVFLGFGTVDAQMVTIPPGLSRILPIEVTCKSGIEASPDLEPWQLTGTLVFMFEEEVPLRLEAGLFFPANPSDATQAITPLLALSLPNWKILEISKENRIADVAFTITASYSEGRTGLFTFNANWEWFAGQAVPRRLKIECSGTGTPPAHEPPEAPHGGTPR